MFVVRDGVEGCVAGATIVTSQGETQLGTTVTDGFGEFKIGLIEMNCGTISLSIEVDG